MRKRDRAVARPVLKPLTEEPRMAAWKLAGPRRETWVFGSDRHGQRWYERGKPGHPGIVERRYVRSLQLESIARIDLPARLIDGELSVAVDEVQSPLPKVVLPARVRESILARLFATTTHDSLEEGGRLDGTHAVDGSLVIRRTVGRGRDRTASQVRLPLNTQSGFLDDATPVGDWHAHPSGVTRPSPRDKKGWRSAAQVVGHPWVGVIAGARRWGDVELACYLTTPEGETYPTQFAEHRRV